MVFEDADVDAAVEGAVVAKMRNNGEACTAANRFHVHAAVADEFTAKLAARMGALAVGRGVDDGVDVGPLIDAAQLTKVERLVDDALARGARALVGGPAAQRPSPGYFYPPTVLDAVPADAELLRDEVFGPVAPIATFDDEAAAIAAANRTEYGLVAYVYTRDLTRALRVIERLETGMVGLNRGIVSNAAAPFGGVKQSGFGREGGSEGISEYLSTKYAAIDLDSLTRRRGRLALDDVGHRNPVESLRTRHRLVGDAAAGDVQSRREAGIGGQRRAGAAIGERGDIGHRGVGERVRRSHRDGARDVRDAVVGDPVDLVGRIGVRGGPRGLEAPALVDRDVDEHGAAPHQAELPARQHPRRARRLDEHRADHQIRLRQALLDLQRRGEARRDGAVEDDVELLAAGRSTCRRCTPRRPGRRRSARRSDRRLRRRRSSRVPGRLREPRPAAGRDRRTACRA